MWRCATLKINKTNLYAYYIEDSLVYSADLENI